MPNEDIDRSRAEMRRRIEELDKKHCKSAAELKKTLQELVKLNVQYLRESVAAAVIECVKRFAVAGTPIDTGRAMAGWHITGDEEESKFVPPPGLPPSEYYDMIQNNVVKLNLSTTDKIYVVNNVEYILALNAGWSKKQAGNFIDMFMMELGRMLNQMASQ